MRPHRRRSAFTIVELLVAMALIIFIMAILAEAFAAGFKAFRDLKALGDMNERLRQASQSLRKYLQADHFEGRKRLSDPNFWADGPPREGFFKIAQGAPSTYEGIGATGVASYSATTHGLHFTAKLRGNNRGDFFPVSYATASNATKAALAGALATYDGYRDLPDTFHSQWVEVAVFLRPTDIAISESGTTPGQLYALHLRAKAVIPQQATANDVQVPRGDLPALADFSIYDNGSTAYANTPSDLGIPARRMPWPPRTLGEDDVNRAGSDVILTDVLSFNVRVFVAGDTDFVDLANLGTYTQTPAAPPYIFDTFTQASQTSLGFPDYGNQSAGTPNPANGLGSEYWVNQIPRCYPNRDIRQVPLRIKALQIQMRVWDLKTEQTRQVTLIVDL